MLLGGTQAVKWRLVHTAYSLPIKFPTCGPSAMPMPISKTNAGRPMKRANLAPPHVAAKKPIMQRRARKVLAPAMV